MAKVGGIFFELSANVAKLQTDLNKANSMISKFSRTAGTALSAVGITLGVGGVIAFLSNCISEANEAEEAMVRLRVTIASLGNVDSIEAVTSAIDEMSKAMMRATGYTDEEIQKVAQRGLLLGIGTKDIEAYTEAVANTASALKIDLGSATEIVNKYLMGSQRAFKGVSDELTTMAKSSATATEKINAVNKVLGPQAQAQMDTYAGKVKMLKNEWGEFAEGVGEKMKLLLLLAGVAGKRMIEAFVNPLKEGLEFANRSPVIQRKLSAQVKGQIELARGTTTGKLGVDDKLGKTAKEYTQDYRGEMEARKALEMSLADDVEKLRLNQLYQRAEIAKNIATADAATQITLLEQLEQLKIKHAEELQKKKETIARAEAEMEAADILAIATQQERIMNEYMKKMEPLTNTMGDMFYDAMTGNFKSFGEYAKQLWGNIAREMANMWAKDIAKSLYGTMTGGEGGGGGLLGFFGKTLGSLLGGLFGGSTMTDADYLTYAPSGPGFIPAGYSSLGPYAKGGAFSRGRVMKYGRGGLVFSPTVFPMAGGAGLMGEAGPEAVIPLKRTASGDLGVASDGGGGGTNIIIHAVDAASFSDMCRRNPSAITGPIEKALKGNSSIRNTIKQTTR